MGQLWVTKGPSSPKLESSGSHDGGNLKVDRKSQQQVGRASSRPQTLRESRVSRSELGQGLSNTS